MHDSPTDVELIARHRIRDRARPRPQLPAGPPAATGPRARTLVARGLRRVADRLDG